MKLTEGPKELGAQQYSDMPHGSLNALSLDRTLQYIDSIDKKIIIEEELYRSMLETLLKLNNKLHNLQGLEYKVFYKKDIEGKTAQRIAEELNYSCRRIEQIIAKIKRRG